MGQQSDSRIVCVLIPRFNMMTVTALVEPTRVANYLAPEQLYAWEFRSPDGGTVTASNGMVIETRPLDDPMEDVGTVFVCGSWGCEHYVHRDLFNWLRRQARSGITLAAVELGVYALARAGLLADRLVTTHWSCMAGFAEQFPQVHMREQLYTIDGRLMTCAGGTAGFDLMLRLISDAHGEQLAGEVADQILHYPIRSAGAAQRHTLGGATDDVHPDVKSAIALIEQHTAEPLSVPDISRRLGISQRQLERLFKHHIGCSIVQFSRLFRLQYARVLLTSTDMSIREVSAASGFNSLSYFSQTFSSCFGRKPSAYRRAWPSDEPAPSWPGTVFSQIQKAQAGNDGALQPPELFGRT